jgi:type II secretory pathway pseudopilin PulG
VIRGQFEHFDFMATDYWPLLSMSARWQKRRARHSPEQGYVLLMLLLMMAVMGIVAATMVTSLKFEMQRDREEEMIHRGVQYSRAIRAYYKKFGRYPATIENLENTNQLRFLRKRYKDPLTGKDFKPLHFGEVKMGLAGMAGMGGTVLPGASTVGANGLTQNGVASSGPGNNPFGNPNGYGQNGQNAPPQTPPNTDSSQTANSTSDSQTTVSSSGTGASSGGTSSDQSSSDQPVQTFGGLPIVGVASTSKATTIREFDKKKKYNEWSFLYDPSLDRGQVIKTPKQPPLQMFGVGPQDVNGQTPTPGLGTSAPGTMAPPGSSNTFGNPNQPAPTPAQQ